MNRISRLLPCVIVFGLAFLFGAESLCANEFRLVPLPTDMEAAARPGSARGENPNGEDAELDNLLEMDMKSLGQVQAKATIGTMTDPIVEAVSKTPEKASEAPGIVDVITAKDIEEFGAKNLYEVLEWATSVYMTGSFMLPQNVACIRGDLRKHEDNLVLILINGRPFRDTTLGGINLSIYTAFPIHTIERIEVIRGPGSVLYGTNAFDGVINVVTKDPKQPTLHASVLNGSYGWQSYSMALGDGNDCRGYYTGATYNRSKGWPFTATLEDMQTDTGRYGQDDVGVFAMYRNHDFTANLFVANPVSEIVGFAPATWPLSQIAARRVFVDLGYVLRFDQCRSLTTNFTYNYAGTEFSIVNPAPLPSLQLPVPAHSFLLEGTYREELADGLDLMIGGVADIHTGSFGWSLPWFREIWYSAYLQLDYRVNEQLKLVGGMQGNMPGVVRGGIVPRVGVIYSHNENWTTKVLFGQAFRSPYHIERYIDVPGILEGNPNLMPETIQTFDAQVAYRTDDYRFAATYFHSNVFNMIRRVGVLPETYVNLGSMEFQGVELENEWRLSEHVRWLGSVSYQNNFSDGVYNSTAAPIWMAKMGGVYHNCRGLNVALMDVFYGARSDPAGSLPVNPGAEAYHLASLNMTVDLNRFLGRCGHREMRLQFLIQNLFNEPINHVEFQRQVINTIPAGPGRTFYGGFTMAY